MTKHTPATCTVGPSAVTGKRCGEPAVFSDGEFAECAKHAADACSIARAAAPASFAPVKVGDVIAVERHGKVYDGRVVHVTRTGKVDVDVTYDNGASRTIRVKSFGKVWA